jgi:predicted hydrocarbon binding protein
MVIKEKLISWLIKKFIISNYKNYKFPGFIVVNFNTSKNVFFREVLVPEDLISDIELKVINNNLNNKKVLYNNIGATLGYNFADLFGVPNLKNSSKEDVDKYARFTFKFNFSTWCKNAEIKKFDIDNHSAVLEFDNHIICRKNGLGTVLTEGAEAGFGKYLFSDKSIEVVQSKCQGRGDKTCLTNWESDKNSKSQNINIIHNYNLEKKFNSIKPLKYSAKSTYDMIKNKIFKLKEGNISLNNQTLFDCSVLLYYLLEIELPKIRGGGKLLYDIGFEYGSKIALNQPLKFIPDFLSATGWGDILITQKSNKIQVNLFYFPWSSLIDKAKDFYLFKGMLSGMLSSTLKRKIKLKKVRKILKKDSLNLIID